MLYYFSLATQPSLCKSLCSNENKSICINILCEHKQRLTFPKDMVVVLRGKTLWWNILQMTVELGVKEYGAMFSK